MNLIRQTFLFRNITNLMNCRIIFAIVCVITIIIILFHNGSFISIFNKYTYSIFDQSNNIRISYRIRKCNTKNQCHSCEVRRNFSNEFDSILERFDLIDTRERFDNVDIENTMPIFVSAWSSNHHDEAIRMCRSLNKYQFLKEDEKRLVVFNLGISKQQETLFVENCRFATFRQFNFSAYPSYVQNLFEYRWKPLVIAEILLEYPAIIWIDTSTIFLNKYGSIKNIFKEIAQNPNRLQFAMFKNASHSIYSTTHPQMYEYLPMQEECAKRTTMYTATQMLWYSTQEIRRRLLKPLVQCALEKDCMGPERTTIYCQFAATDRYRTFANCHRFDQSAVNIIASSLVDNNELLYRFYNTSIAIYNGRHIV